MRLTLQSALEGVEVHNAHIRAEIKPGPHDDFLLEQSTKDAVAGFATDPLRWSQLVRHTKGAPIPLIPRCVISQSSGIKRVIDDAAKGGQSALSSDANKLVLCSPPAQHIAAAMSFLTLSGRVKSPVDDSSGVCGHLVTPGVARAGLPDLRRPPFWAAVGSDKFQQQGV